MTTGRRRDTTPGDFAPGGAAAPHAPVDLPYRRGRRKGQDGFGGGLVALRGALTDLARAPLGVLTGITVTLDLSATSGQGRLLLELCRELGERYDLEVLPRLEGSTCDVRCRRRAVLADQPGGPDSAPSRPGRARTAGRRVPEARRSASAEGS